MKTKSEIFHGVDDKEKAKKRDGVKSDDEVSFG